MSRPIKGTFPEYFERYTDLVKEDELLLAFKCQQEIIDNYFNSISEEKSTYAYAPGKWTIKDVLQHIIDTERIFCYRALCIARKETTSLPGFEEDDYAKNANGNGRTWKDLVAELKAVRKATEIMFNSFTKEMLEQSGISNNKAITVNAIGFIIPGHVIHHVNVLKERYF